jgi:hypothetical protein
MQDDPKLGNTGLYVSLAMLVVAFLVIALIKLVQAL